MSTNFETGFGNDDIIEAEHVKQFAKPINDLESGKAFFREATNTAEVYEVDFSESSVPGGAPGHVLESLEPGQMIVFKASADSEDNAELEVALEGASPGSYPLFAGDTQISQGQIKENQIVVAIFNNQGGGRFDVVGVSSGSSGGGGGAESLNDLDDVTITSPVTGEVLRFDGSEFVNAEMAIADVDGLSAALASKQDTSEKGQVNGYASLGSNGLVPSSQLPAAVGGVEKLDDLDDVNVANPEEGQVLRYDDTAEKFVNSELAVTDVDGLSAALDTKQDELTEPADVPGLTAALAGKADTSHTHAASDIVSGEIPIARGGTGADNPGDARSNLNAQTQDDSLDEIASLSLVKGDLLVHDGSEVGKLSPGTNGQVLSADSGEATGLKWVTPSGGGGGGGPESLDDLDDVSIDSPEEGDILQYDGDEFINVSSSEAREGLGISVSADQIAYGDTDGLTSNSSFVFSDDRLGVGTSSPARGIHVEDSEASQQRWSHSSNDHVELRAQAGGNLTLSLTGNQLAIGGSCTGANSLAIGKGSEAEATNTAVGSIAKALGYTSTALGMISESGTLGTALGAAAKAEYYNTAIGYGSVSSIANSCTIGSQQLPINSIYGGKGESHESPSGWGLKGTAGHGTNKEGGDLFLDAGAGTGNASSGSGRLRASNPESSGDTLQQSYNDLIAWKHNAIGFFGATPVSQQELQAPLVDNSGGNAGTTLASSPTSSISNLASHVDDIVASLVARITALEAKLVATTLVTQES